MLFNMFSLSHIQAQMFKHFKRFFLNNDVYLTSAKQPYSYFAQACFIKSWWRSFLSTSTVYVNAEPQG
jgi:hypothetical protein